MCSAAEREARERAQGLVGLLDRFARLPTDVREAAVLTKLVGRVRLPLASSPTVVASLITAAILALFALAISTSLDPPSNTRTTCRQHRMASS